MASLGWRVLATDIPHVISSVLSHNIHANIHHVQGTVQVRELDWSVPPHAWIWDHPSVIASPSPPPSHDNPHNLLRPPFDLICTADTVYDPSLIPLLLRSLHALCLSAPAARPPPVYICLERRDPLLVDSCLADAHHTWGFHVQRIPHRKLVKAMLKARLDWPKEDWEGIEIWKLTLSQS
ncbi:hypothetical protein H0H92_013441 [Tricholoma furcatifolium]|nr:hypothetical protein H0H92_013441 [Tricholoma furcatifolium]